MLRRSLAGLTLGALLGGLLVVLTQAQAFARHCDEDENPGSIEIGCDHNGGGGNGGGGVDNDPCDYEYANPQPARDILGDPQTGPGAWYWQSCPFGENGTLGRLVWLPTRDPQSIAVDILARIRISGADIHIRPENVPGSKGLVGLPVWVWTTPGMPYFGTQTDTDGGGGISVRLTVTSQKIVWDMGDGTTVTCGAGIEYQDSFGTQDPRSIEGGCGHRYTKSSKSQPGGRYTITATTHWQATWAASNGEGGTINVTRSSSTSVRIEELQVVIG